MNPCVGCCKVASLTGFVSERPHDHARVVLVSFEHSFGSVNECSLPLRLVCKALVGVVTHTVTLDVGLIHDIHSVEIAEFVPHRVVRVVGCADAVDIVLLHQFDVLDHGLSIHYVSCVRVVLVSVHTFDIDRLAVHEELGMLGLGLAETDEL